MKFNKQANVKFKKKQKIIQLKCLLNQTELTASLCSSGVFEFLSPREWASAVWEVFEEERDLTALKLNI